MHGIMSPSMVGACRDLPLLARAERVNHLQPDASFIAHLSIYRFAKNLTRNAVVLDVGSGTGYGAHYLAGHGAKLVLGIDSDRSAVKFSRRYFFRENLRFRVARAEDVQKLVDDYFDVIFSSNTLEHVADVGGFFATAMFKLKRNGRMIIAVPPITSETSAMRDLSNPYHVNMWSPRQWHHVLSTFFERIRCFRHRCDLEHEADLTTSADATELFARDFSFLPVSIDELQADGGMTAVFVAHGPQRRIVHRPLTFVDYSFSREPVSRTEMAMFHVGRVRRRVEMMSRRRIVK
jgi:2-polyprenyl-3-methyl-5-hydroxy-6-metoxy-1,4-benzoquinol methylase